MTCKFCIEIVVVIHQWQNVGKFIDVFFPVVQRAESIKKANGHLFSEEVDYLISS